MFRTTRLRLITLFAALLGCVGLGASTARADQLQYLTQASANVMAAARVVGNISTYGYLAGTSFVAGNIQDGGECDFTVTLDAGGHYLFLGGGDDDARDVGIEVRAESGALLATSKGHDAAPDVFYTPDTTGRYTLHLLMRDTKTTTSFGALALLEQDGLDVPINNLGQAMDSLQAFTRRIEALSEQHGSTVSLQSNVGEWAVYGAILKSGEEAGLVHVHPGAGAHCIIAAGDNNAATVNLTVTGDAPDADPDGPTLGSDTDHDPEAIVALKTDADDACRIHTKMTHSTDDHYALVLTGVLAVN